MRMRLEQVGGPALAEPNVPLQQVGVEGFAEAKQVLLIGRGTDCALILPDASISRRHAKIELRGTELWLIDLESRSGTFINDVKLEASLAAPLYEHDRIRIGQWRFRLRSENAPERSFTQSPKPSTSTFGLTQIGAPVLAAQARLELLVEFVAACTEKNSLEEIALTLMDFAGRASLAKRISVFDPTSMIPLCVQPDHFRAKPYLDAFEAAARGGIVIVDVSATQSAAVVALRIDGEAVAFLQVEFEQARPKDEALESLHALSRLAGFSAGNSERRKAEKRIERLSADLEHARRVQQCITPPSEGIFGRTRYALHVHPGRVVAGDLVDIFPLPGNKTAIVLGDVSGAGFGAAVQMASAQAYLHAELLETANPATAATRCNTYLARIGGGQFVTAWIAVLEESTGMLHTVDAGHGHGRFADTEHVRPFNFQGGPPLGIDAEQVYRAESIILSPGTRIVLFSDGIAEHRNNEEVMFQEHIDAILKRCHTPAEDVDNLLSALRLHTGKLPDDDATLLSIALE
jgi:phosphoserine phosphatase RsbU/P